MTSSPTADPEAEAAPAGGLNTTGCDDSSGCSDMAGPEDSVKYSPRTDSAGGIELYENIRQRAVPFGPLQITYNEGSQCALMVDEHSRVIIIDNQSAIPISHKLLPTVTAPTPWTEVGKCTYRVFMAFRKRLAHGVPDSKVSQWNYGTAVHIGEGLFLSNAHVFSWPRSVMNNEILTHIRYEAKAYLRSGSGDIHEKGIPGTGIFSNDLVAQVVGWPPTLLANALTEGYQVKGGLMEHHYNIPLLGDAVLLKATDNRWLARLRRTNRPHVLPSNLGGIATPLRGTLVTINGDTEDFSKYSETANTSEQLERAVNSLLPNVISFSSDNVEQCIITADGTRREASREEEPQLLRYKLSAVSGSSGGGVYDNTTKRLIGLNTKSETDLRSGMQIKTTSHRNRTCAVALTSPVVKELIAHAIIPEFQKIQNESATSICHEWEKLR